jgi:hypothetical protein
MSYTPQKQHNPTGDVKVPEAIRRASERASELHRQAYESGEPKGDEPAKADDQQEQPKGDDNGGANGTERQPAEAKFSGQEDRPKEGTEVPAETPAAPPPAADNWEHKYNTLMGRYRKMGDQLRETTSQMSILQREVDELKAKRTPTQERAESLISQQERTEYGEDFLDVAARAAREKVDPELRELRNTVASLQGQLESQTRSSQQQSQKDVFNRLGAEIPEWQDINRSQDFLNWLALRDPMSGAIRNDLLQAAFNSFDGERVVRIFKGFLSDEATVAPQDRPAATAPTQSGSGKVPLEQFAAPGRAKTAAATPPPAGKPIITPAEISAFYRDVQRGTYRGREREQHEMEQQIFDAQNDGRVR